MRFDYSALRGLIVSKCGSISNFCRENDYNIHNFLMKLNNHTKFSIPDVLKIATALDIPQEEIGRYFFCVESSD